jgi:hypothetical protein
MRQNDDRRNRLLDEIAMNAAANVRETGRLFSRARRLFAAPTVSPIPEPHPAGGVPADIVRIKEFAMHLLSKIAFAALVGGSAVAMTASGAAARIVCNGEGDCWRPRGDFEFLPAAGITVHPDNWHWGKDEHFAWREHEGRGYWRSGRWTEF